jgi:hypothetical protein
MVVLLADAAAEVEDVDQFFDEADDHSDHGNGSVDWKGGDWAGFPPDCPPGFLGGLPLMPKLWANRVMVAGAGLRLGCSAHSPTIPTRGRLRDQ